MQIVQSLLETMGGLSKPQVKGLTTLFATILIVCGKVNFTNLSRYSLLSEKTDRRRFKRSFPLTQFNLEVVRSAVRENAAMIAVMDCSFIPKSGKKTFGLDQFYHGSHGRVEKGLEVSLVAVVNVETEVGYSIQAEQTFEQAMFPELTRMDYYLDQLERVRGHLPGQVRYLAVDGAYAHHPFVTGVVTLNLDVISRLRRDANLRFLFEGKQKVRGARRKYAGKVNLADSTGFTWVRQLQPGVDLFTQVVWHVTLKRQIRLAYLQDTRKPNKPSYVVLFSTDVQQSADEIYRFYKLRFQIEFIFRFGQAIHGSRGLPSARCQKAGLPL
jgi:DDE superfamily endonuclease